MWRWRKVTCIFFYFKSTFDNGHLDTYLHACSWSVLNAADPYSTFNSTYISANKHHLTIQRATHSSHSTSYTMSCVTYHKYHTLHSKHKDSIPLDIPRVKPRDISRISLTQYTLALRVSTKRINHSKLGSIRVEMSLYTSLPALRWNVKYILLFCSIKFFLY